MDLVREKVCSFDNLYRAMNKCKKGVSWKDSVSRYTNNGLVSTLKLHNQLMDNTYKIDDYYNFIIREPKTRDIVSTKFKDRVFQRSLCDNYFYDKITRSFIYDNGACQIGKGTGFSRERLKVHMSNFYKHNGNDGYVLKCDFKNYFGSTPHRVAKDALRRAIDNDWVLSKSNDVVDSYDSNGDGIGMGLGSQITQLLQLLVLDRLDHIMKEDMSVKHYVRYMDDIVIIHKDKDYLNRCLLKIEDSIRELGLTLNSKKTQIFELKQGINFLGFKYKLLDTGKVICLLHKENIYKRKRKIRKHKVLLDKGIMSVRKADECYESWRAHAKQGNTYGVMKNMDMYYNTVIGDNQYVQEINRTRTITTSKSRER